MPLLKVLYSISTPDGSKLNSCCLPPCWLCLSVHTSHQDVLDEKLAAERAAVESLRSQTAAARSALESEQALVSQLKEEASIAGAASQQLMALEQQVGTGCELCSNQPGRTFALACPVRQTPFSPMLTMITVMTMVTSKMPSSALQDHLHSTTFSQ